MIQIYTGEGKGKTTAAVGLSVRALGAGKKVLFIQLLKDGASSEIPVLKELVGLTVECFGEGKMIVPGEEDQKEKQNSLKAIRYVKEQAENYDLVVIDEALTAVTLNVLAEEELLGLIHGFPKEMELVLTGHGITEKLIEAADLVTDMKPVKHYYEKGIKARKGIEW